MQSSMKVELDARYTAKKEEQYIARLKKEIVVTRILLVIATLFTYAVVALFVTGKLCI